LLVGRKITNGHDRSCIRKGTKPAKQGTDGVIDRMGKVIGTGSGNVDDPLGFISKHVQQIYRFQ
jgi:hypothetical protein